MTWRDLDDHPGRRRADHGDDPVASGRVPPLQATLLDLEDAAGRPILQRFWGTACPRDEVVYVVLFINERYLVFALSG
jgi:hypothetical protein